MANENTLYEAMYILPTDIEEEEIQTATGPLIKVVEDAGGEIVSDEEFGRRRLAYEIDNHTEGIYRIMYFRGSGEAVSALKTQFTLSEQIIRGLVVVANPEAIFHSVAQKEQAAQAEQEAVDESEEAKDAEQQPEAAEEQVEEEAAASEAETDE